MIGPAPKPIASTRADDPELEERIDAFVFALGDRVDGLQDLEAEGALAPLEAAAVAFGDESSELGYEPLAVAAHELALACRERNPEAVHKSVVDITELSKRVRIGHRGAA